MCGHLTIEETQTGATAPDRQEHRTGRYDPPGRRRGDDDLLAFANRSLVDPAHLERQHDRIQLAGQGRLAEALLSSLIRSSSHCLYSRVKTDGSTRELTSVPTKSTSTLAASWASVIRAQVHAAAGPAVTSTKAPISTGTVSAAPSTLRIFTRASPVRASHRCRSDGQPAWPVPTNQLVPAGRSYPTPGPAPIHRRTGPVVLIAATAGLPAIAAATRGASVQQAP